MPDAGAAKKPSDALGRAHKSARLGRPFDAKKRQEFLELIRDGYSKVFAAPQVGVHRKTVAEWLKSGASANPKHPEHRKFAEDYMQAEAEGTGRLYKKMTRLADEDTKAGLALLRARGVPGFGPTLREQTRQHAADVRARELATEKAELDVRMLRVRVDVAEAAANGKSETPGFGLAALLGDEDLALEVRQAAAAWAVRKGYVAVERKDWAA